MPSLSPSAIDSGVRVVVTPSQSSYFAGEPFAVTITFTNTRSPQSGPSRPNTHKRGAHSISSAPIARPPTSPGTLRTSVTPASTQPKSREDVSTKKGLVGKSFSSKGEDELPELIEQRRKKLLAKSLSVSIPPHELEQIGEGVVPKSASFVQKAFDHHLRVQPASPRISSPLSRSDTFPLKSNHPHARKQSVLDGQASPELVMATTTSPISPYTPNPSSSTFSLDLGPIAEGTITPYTSTPSIASPSLETGPYFPSLDAAVNNTSNTVYAYPLPRPAAKRASLSGPQSQSGLGHGQPPPHLKLQSRNAFSATFTPANTELILYSYAQLKGTLFLASPSAHGGPPASPNPNQYSLNSIRAALLKKGVVGGGRMDITSSLNHPHPAPQHRRRATHGRSSSFSSGLLSLLSPTSLVASASAPPGSPTPWTPGSASSFGSQLGSSALASPSSPSLGSFSIKRGVWVGLGIPDTPGTGAGIATGPSEPVEEEEIDPDEPLPSFEVQPAMLGVDLSLMPGESRSYTYSIMLPENLPPTFKGKCLKFSYELVIGTCRAASSSPSASVGSAPRSANSVSRIMKVPIRVYNHVVVGRTPRPYDLLWPVSKRIGPSLAESQGKVVEEAGGRTKDLGKSYPPSPITSAKGVGETFDDLQDYAQRLLTSFPDPSASGVRIKLPAESISPVVPSENWTGGGMSGVGWNAEEEGRRLERERERVEEGALTGCREAVEILTRNPKKASYDVNKDGVKVAVLTFTKAAYRLGETVLGVVELNERISTARVLQLSAILEAHESLPSSISGPSTSRQLRRVHAEHHSSFTTCTLRTTFALDIPSDASPAFQVRVGSPQPGAPPTTLGGLEWKVRLCLLVAVTTESAQPGTEGVRIKHMRRDGPRGEWGSSWRAPSGIAPMEKPTHVQPVSQETQNIRQSWAAFFASSIIGTSMESAFHDGDEGDEQDVDGHDEDEGVYDGVKPDRAGGVGVGVNFGGGEEGWRDVKLETVECEVPIKLWPGNTAFKAVDVVFDV